MVRRALMLFLLVLPALGGCDGQVDPEYKGEAIATIRGSVVEEAPGVRTSAVEAALVWHGVQLNKQKNFNNTPIDQRLLTKAAVTGSFPATFTMKVYTLPPDEAFVSCYKDGDPRAGRMALGSVGVVDEGTPFLDDQNIAALRGWASGHSVIYLDHDIAPGSDCGLITDVTTAGYHLVQRRGTPEELEASKEALPACLNAASCAPRTGSDDVRKAMDACFAKQEALFTLIDAPLGMDTPITITMLGQPLTPAPEPTPTPAPPKNPPPSPPGEPQPSTDAGCP